MAFSRRPASARGAYALSSRNVGRDAVDASSAQDERAACVRRSRVVLTPRRWRQAGRDAFASWPATGARKPGPRREHEGTRKTIARGMPEMFGLPVVAILVCFHSSHARLRVRRRTGIPCALFFRGRQCLLHDPGADTPRERGGVSCGEPRGDEAPWDPSETWRFGLYARRLWGGLLAHEEMVDR